MNCGILLKGSENLFLTSRKGFGDSGRIERMVRGEQVTWDRCIRTKCRESKLQFT